MICSQPCRNVCEPAFRFLPEYDWKCIEFVACLYCKGRLISYCQFWFEDFAVLLNPSVEHNGLLGGSWPIFIFFFELNLMKFINAEPVPGFSELIQMKISVLSERISKTPNNQAPTLQIISIRSILELIGVEIFQRKLLWRFPVEFSGAGASSNDVKVPAQQKRFIKCWTGWAGDGSAEV